jgi:secreted PhoX family phosphatase
MSMKDVTRDDQNNLKLFDDDGTVDVMPGTDARPFAADPFHAVLDKTMSRRAVLKGTALAGATLVLTPGVMTLASTRAEAAVSGDPSARLTFETVMPGNEPDVVVPPNYTVDVLLRWGDPLTPGAPAFDVDNQSPEAQSQQFGYNADLVLFYPVPGFVKRTVDLTGGLSSLANRALGAQYPRLKGRSSHYAVMVVNHEYTKGSDMFPGYVGGSPTESQVLTEIEAHGFSIVGLTANRGAWSFDINSPFNRRVTGSTPMIISGPLRGHALMKTAADPAGETVLGCLNNCAGGKTPWGTILTCEENFDQYFANFNDVPDEIKALSTRIAAPGGASGRKWEDFVDRFDLSTDPTEYNRFGYIVEIDPYDPNDVPKKRTAMGRFKHEGAACRVTDDGRVAVYSGDDARFEYVFKFVSDGRYSMYNRASNKDLLDSGVLYAARFDAGDVEGDDMGTGVWLPLVWEPGNALDQAGFNSQAEVLINTRGAADVMGATPMDRPEDIEVSPTTGRVHVCLTNNSRRDGNPGDTRIVNGREVSSAPDESNPRNNTYDHPDGRNTGNQHGHVIEIIETADDAGALTFNWNILIKCGDPMVPAHNTSFGDIADPAAAGVSPIADPDNVVHDSDGNLWISTDGQYFSASAGFGQNDGVFAVPVEGPNRGLLRQFLSGVPGGEVCGPEFSGDERTFFCAIQHPNDGNAFNAVWPIGDPDGVSKPSLIAVRENSGRKVGV